MLRSLLCLWYCVVLYNGFFLTLKKDHKPETFVFVFFFLKKKRLTLFDISLLNISSSAIEVQVSRIPDGFSVKHSFLNTDPLFVRKSQLFELECNEIDESSKGLRRLSNLHQLFQMCL